MDHINVFTIFLLYLQNASMYIYIICTLNTIPHGVFCAVYFNEAFTPCLVLNADSSPVTKEYEVWGKEWLHLKMLGKQLHFQEIPSGKSHDRGKASFVTFLSLPLLLLLSCGSWLCADLGHWCEVPRMASRNRERSGARRAHSIPGLPGLEGTSGDRLFQAPHQGRVISSR